jgi:NarL family two-component system response regulator LiaR
MLVDDHAVVRSGLGAFLLAFDDLELVAEANGGEEAVRLCKQMQPDVVLMDLVMPGMDGAAATRAIRERCPQIQVIALTSFKEKELVQGVLEAGAIGYLLKNVSADELADAIRAAHAGRPTLAPEAAQALIQTTTQPPEPGYSHLTRSKTPQMTGAFGEFLGYTKGRKQIHEVLRMEIILLLITLSLLLIWTETTGKVHRYEYEE